MATKSVSRDVFVRKPFNYDMNAASLASGTPGGGAIRTQQHQKDETDINLIVKRFGITGMLPQNVRVPLSSDFVDILDFQSAQNALVQAKRSFSAMSADVRTRFGNDPAKFVAFCSDSRNIDEMRKMGLAVPAKIKEELPNTFGDGNVKPSPPKEDLKPK